MRRHARRGYSLVTTLALLPIVALLLVTVGKVWLDTLHVEQLARQYAERRAAMGAIERQLRSDLRSAVSYAASPAHLTLRTSAGERVDWRIAGGSATRSSATDGSRRWSAARLSFLARVERAPSGALLRLTYLETPPRRSIGLPARPSEVTFALPPPATDDTGAKP